MLIAKSSQVTNGVINGLAGIASVATVVLDLLIGGAALVVDNWSWLAPIVGGVATAFLVLNGAMLAYKTVTGIVNALETVKAARLAMTTVATYSSVSTFVGGPGMAWAIGYGWLYMAIVQVVVIFLVLGIFGKKIAMVSRKIDAVTVVDVIRSRYQSDLLANISALVIVAFFCATMVAQFVGAAKLFEAVTGFS